jgi:hypothetical protein
VFGVGVSRTGSQRQNNDRVQLSVQFVMFARREMQSRGWSRRIENDHQEEKKQTETIWTDVKDSRGITPNCASDQEF